MRSLLVKNAHTIVTCDDFDSVFTNADLYAEDGVIVHVGATRTHAIPQDADTVIDATDQIIYPGLVNAHHHMCQTFTRNLPQMQNLELFHWLTSLYEYWENLDAEVMYYASLVAMGELIKSGCTTCFDHNYAFPCGGKGFLEAEFNAASQLGERVALARGSMSLSRKNGGLPPESLVQTTEEILEDSRRCVEQFHDPSRFSMRQVVIAPCAPFNVTADLMKESAALARSLNVRLHTHLAETIDEERYALEHVGMRPLAYMKSLGWLGEDVWFAHGIHFNDDELDLLADTGTGVVHCPISNMKLSSGIARITEMIQLGIPVGLGVDGSSSNDGSNLLEEMRVGYLLHRLKESDHAPTGYDMLRIATRGGAKVLGRNDIGRLEAGCAADFFMIDMKRIETVGALADPMALLATVGYRGAVDRTVVAGTTIMEHGRLCGIDEEEVAHKANDCWRRFLKKHE